jgi:Flp pilus assembly protein TadG
MPASRRTAATNERGSAATEFVMVSALLVFLLFAVLQVAGFCYVRSVAAAAASDGARFAASADADPAAGSSRASGVLTRGLGRRLSSHVARTGSIAVDAASGLSTSRVECQGHLRSLFLPIGEFVNLHVIGESLKERR